VSLLTYRPRFDPDDETWFADVTIRPGADPQPFVRLGLVRYQPNASELLRVSEPVIEWAQIPEDRTVTVKVDKDDPRRIEVIVSGAGRAFSAGEASGHDATRLGAWLHRPLMKVSVLRRRSDGIEEPAMVAEGSCPGFSPLAERAWIPTTQEELDAYLGIQQPEEGREEARSREHPALVPDAPGRSGAPLTWTTTFLLREPPLRAGDGASYSVLVEEVEATRPSTYRSSSPT